MSRNSIKRWAGLLGLSGSSVAVYFYIYGHMHDSSLEEGRRNGRSGVSVAESALSQLEGRRDMSTDSEHPRHEHGVKERIENLLGRRKTLLKNLPFAAQGGSDARVGPAQSTADLVPKHLDMVHRLRQEAEKKLHKSLPPRFNDEELLRYALHNGLLRAKTNVDLERVFEKSLESILDSYAWFQEHIFADCSEIQEYSNLIWWEYSEGVNERPILHVDIGKAVTQCTGSKALHFANVVITLMELGVTGSSLSGMTKKDPLDRIDVIIYAEGTTPLSASKVFWILRAVVRTLSHHYPGRLNELTLYDLPIVLSWIITGVKRVIHDDTARKLHSRQSH